MVIQIATRPSTYSSWSEVSMLKAMQAVESEGLAVRVAAEMYGVPKSTLYDRVRGKVKHGTKPGPVPYLSIEEEIVFANFLIKSAKIGYPRTVSRVLGLVQQIVVSKGLTKVSVS